MTPKRSAELNARWDAINARLAAIHAAGLTDSPETYDEEQALLGELDAIEGETGAHYLAEQRRQRAASPFPS